MFTYQPNPISSSFFASPRTYEYPYQSFDYVPRGPSRYAYARALAEEERRERERLARQSRYFASPYGSYNPYDSPYEEDDSEDAFVPTFGRSVDARERAYLQAQKHCELERLRTLRAAEEENRRRKAEDEVLQRFFNNSRANDSAHHNSRSKSRTPSPSTRIPINVTTPSPNHATLTGSLKTSNNPSTSTSDMQEAAARTIQSFYRTQRALHAVSNLRHELDALVSGFSYPRKLDFLVDGQTISVDVASNLSLEDDREEEEITIAPKLAYTPANIPFRVYDDKLQKLLAKLDAVSTELLTGEGRKRVRDSRRKVVRDTEREAARLEQWVKRVWESRHDGEKSVRTDEEPGMEVEEAHLAEVAGSSELGVALVEAKALDEVIVEGDDESFRTVPEYPTEIEKQDIIFDRYEDMEEPQDLQIEDVQDDDDITVVDASCDLFEDVSSLTNDKLKSTESQSSNASGPIQVCATGTSEVKQAEGDTDEAFVVL